MSLPHFVGQSLFEAGEAGGELLDLPQVGGRCRGDALLHALIFDLDHLVELAEGRRNRVDALVVFGPDLLHRQHNAHIPAS